MLYVQGYAGRAELVGDNVHNCIQQWVYHGAMRKKVYNPAKSRTHSENRGGRACRGPVDVSTNLNIF